MKPLTIQKRTSALNGIVCYEPVDLPILNKLIGSNLLLKNWKDETTRDTIGCEKKQLMRYRGKYDPDRNAIKIKYERSSGMSFGRSNPEAAIGLFGIRRQVRHTLCRNNGLVDWDIANCHPTLLLQICKENGLKCVELEKYVTDRQAIISRLMDITKCSKDRAKQLFIRLLYFGSFEKWLKETKDKDGVVIYEEIDIYAFQGHEDFTKYIYDLISELDKIGTRVVDANPKLKKEVEKAKKKKGTDDYNVNGSVVSYFLQEYEITILECIYEYCVNSGYIINNVCVLCADGIMLEKDLIDEKDIAGEFHTVVKEKLGFDLRFENKPMDEFYTDEDFEKNQLDISILDNSKMDIFNTEYFNGLEDYQTKKLYFEHFVFKVLRPDPVYVYIEKDGKLDDMVFYSRNKILDTFSHLGSGIFDTAGIETKFINIWLGDQDIKQYNKMDFIPLNQNTKVDAHIFNLFRGFNPACYAEYEVEKQDKLLKPFMDLGKALCTGDDKLLDYLLRYIADIFQNPNKKNPIAFIIKGKQGTGKNVWLNAVGNLLGKVHYITSSNPKDFFGEYAEGFYHKLLVNMNECEGKDTFDFEGRIKSFITEDTITLNKKFVQPITISNLARLIIFTNKTNPIPIDVRTKERRYVVYETADTFLEDRYGTVFWKKLIAHFERPDFMAALYNHFMNIDLKDYDWRGNRPITTAYRNMCKLYVPTEVLFIEHHCRTKMPLGDDEDGVFADYNQKMIKSGISGQQLYNEYLNFSKEFGFTKEGSFQKNIKTFYAKLTELEFPMVQRKPAGIVTYTFDILEVMNHMKRRKWIDLSDEELNSVDYLLVDTKGEEFDELFDV